MEKEKVKLDEVLKFLFSTSNKVLVKLLNGIFNENFSVDEVELTVSNNEFVEDDLGIAREWLRPSQGPPGVLKISSGKLM